MRTNQHEAAKSLDQFLKFFSDSRPNGPESLLISHGVTRHYDGKYPRGFARGLKKQCFQNAANLAREEGLLYVEGYAISREIGIPLHHAWCESQPEGKVYDPTWAGPGVYRGLAMPSADLWLLLFKQKTYGLLMNHTSTMTLDGLAEHCLTPDQRGTATT